MTPQNAAGPRTDPPQSVPMASGAKPAAVAAAPPPLEAPGVRFTSQGLRVWPKTALVVLQKGSSAISGRLVLPSRIAPASVSRWTQIASASATWSANSRDP